MQQTWAGRRVLVTGASGFIGGALARRLHALGADVVALERTPGAGDPLRAEGLTVVRGDVTDAARMAELLAEDVEVVFHLAAWLSGRRPADATRVNVEGTRALAAFAAKAGAQRFVFTSSIAVYGAPGDADVDEQTPVKPFGDPYGDSKIAAEAALWDIARETGMQTVVVRPGMVYGPESPGWSVRMIRSAAEGTMPLIGGGRGTAYPVYIDNLIDLLLLAGTHPAAPGKTFNGVDDGPVTLAQFLGAYMDMIGTKRAVRLPCWLAQAGAVVLNPFVRSYHLPYLIGQICGHGQIANDHAKQVLGWQPAVSFAEGMRRTEVWLREVGEL